MRSIFFKPFGMSKSCHIFKKNFLRNTMQILIQLIDVLRQNCHQHTNNSMSPSNFTAKIAYNTTKNFGKVSGATMILSILCFTFPTKAETADCSAAVGIMSL
uniref:Uncharacterized protein n=1 Tax=Meloidogyne incognita TaxID=6306 RepID=A0A914N3X5_MELIC